MQMEQATSADADSTMHEHHKLIPSDRVEGTPVRRPDGRRIGFIKRLMIDKVSGQIVYAVLNFGGFMGLGQKHYAVAWDRLKYDVDVGAYQMDLSDAELHGTSGTEGAADFDWGDRTDPIVVPNYQRKPTYWGAY